MTQYDCGFTAIVSFYTMKKYITYKQIKNDFLLESG